MMVFPRIASLFVPVLSLLLAACSQPADEDAAPATLKVTAPQAAVAIPDPYAAEIAATILQRE